MHLTPTLLRQWLVAATAKISHRGAGDAPKFLVGDTFRAPSCVGRSGGWIGSLAERRHDERARHSLWMRFWLWAWRGVRRACLVIGEAFRYRADLEHAPQTRIALKSIEPEGSIA